MDLESAKKQIRNTAGELFPAQELWIRPVDLRFWAFQKYERRVITTEGSCDFNGVYHSVDIHETDDVERYVEEAVKRKTEERYECFAILL